MATAKVEGISVLLCKPLTYMNNSGRAVAEVLSRYGIDPEGMLVVVDDIVLPLGKLRLRSKGSDGGHNGLYSVISEIGSNVFPRLRCGIGREQKPTKEKIPEFVLSPFEQEERPEVNAMVSRAADAALEFVRLGLANAMTRVNR
jgi:PTH1 family peptidyl-tRNA hydrolase